MKDTRLLRVSIMPSIAVTPSSPYSTGNVGSSLSQMRAMTGRVVLATAVSNTQSFV